MNNFCNKTFISYNGGSAGDLFTKSCNGISLEDLPDNFVPNNSSIKKYEKGILDQTVTLESLLKDKQERYISTHLSDYLLDLGANIINIVIESPEVQEQVICRQMFFQRLSIEVDYNQTVFSIIQKWCSNGKYQMAANYWFENARKLWLASMNKRLRLSTHTLNFDKIFASSWTDSLVDQGWKHNVSILNKNHKLWLTQNGNFAREDTIESMAKKLMTMPWNQQTGTITYYS